MVSRMPLTEQTAQSGPQVLLVGEKDSKRLLEVYVKRSLSLNDGAQHPHRRERRTNKWVTLAEKNKKDRKHSSDTSLHLNISDSEEDLGKDEAFSEPETGKLQETAEKPEHKSKRWRKRATLKRNDGSSASHKSDGKPKKWFLPKDKRDVKQPNKKQESDDFRDEALPQPSLADELESSTEAKKPKDSKKSKKSSVWKTVLGWFSRGNSEKQEEKEKEAVRTEEDIPPIEPSSPPVSCLPFPDVLSNGDAVILRRKPSRRRSQRKSSLKRRSRDMGLDKATGRPCNLDLSSANHETTVKSIEEVEPTSSYYEKMAEVLENIVHEIKNSPTEENRTFLPQPTAMNGLSMSKEEVIERISALIKQEGDIMDPKLKENPTIRSFFSMLSYGSFQQLADQYVQSELPKQKKTQPSVAAPELVKFAFTLDFTARVASLSRHTSGHILGFGNQYLKDRFTYMSESQPHNSDMTK
ncbi:uncharacterized protein [Salminus brasiliensis]|uniref:uncharacterized protein n=1 Tax=Salminus brasiliensis TaxID=930266 RepID=UPI003B831FEE